MKKILIIGLRVSAFVLLIGFLSGIKADMGEKKVIFDIFTEKYSGLTLEQKVSVYNEVVKQDELQSIYDLEEPLIASSPRSFCSRFQSMFCFRWFQNDKGNRNENDFARGVLEALIAEAVKKVVVDDELAAQSSSDIEIVLKLLNAQPLEFFEAARGAPTVIQIKVPEQKGEECGINVLANLLAVNKLVNSEVPFLSDKFTDFSTRLLGEDLKDCLRELSDDQIVKYAKKIGLSNLIMVLSSEPDQVFGYSVVGNNSLQQLVSRKEQVINIVLHRVVGHSHHWTAVSVVRTDNMEKPVIVFMESLGNKKASKVIKNGLRYIASEMKGD